MIFSMTQLKWIYGLGTAFAIVFITWAITFDHNKQKDAYLVSLEKQQQELKIANFQKDLDYLVKENCKLIAMRAMNKDNQVKEVIFVKVGNVADEKYITIDIDGQRRNYDYAVFMSKVLKIECGDDYKW